MDESCAADLWFPRDNKNESPLHRFRIAEGATLVAGGEGMPDGLDSGFYVKPTVFADVSQT